MDPFVQFNLLIVNATTTPAAIERKDVVRERVDLIARQFRDALAEGDASDTSPHGIALTPEFKIRRQSNGLAAWLSFMVDDGDGKTEHLQEVAKILLLREPSPESRQLLAQHAPTLNPKDLPSDPTAIVLRLTEKVPLMIREWYPKVAAGYFAPAP